MNIYNSRLFADRGTIENSFKNRLENIEQELLIIGITLEGLLTNYKPYLKEMIENNKIIKLLLLDPTSQHVEGHQPYSDRNIVVSIIDTIDGRLLRLFENLSLNERKNIEVKITKYLPRFSVEMADKKRLYINFHLYKRNTHNNPVLYLNKTDTPDEFNTFYLNIKKLYEETENYIIKDGKWLGFKLSNKDNKYEIQIIANERLIKLLKKNKAKKEGINKMDLKQLLKRNFHDKLLDELFPLVKNDKIQTNQIVIINSWFNYIKEQKNLNIIDDKYFQTELNKITKSLLNIIDEI